MLKFIKSLFTKTVKTGLVQYYPSTVDNKLTVVYSGNCATNVKYIDFSNNVDLEFSNQWNSDELTSVNYSMFNFYKELIIDCNGELTTIDLTKRKICLTLYNDSIGEFLDLVSFISWLNSTYDTNISINSTYSFILNDNDATSTMCASMDKIYDTYYSVDMNDSSTISDLFVGLTNRPRTCLNLQQTELSDIHYNDTLDKFGKYLIDSSGNIKERLDSLPLYDSIQKLKTVSSVVTKSLDIAMLCSHLNENIEVVYIGDIENIKYITPNNLTVTKNI